MHFYDRCRVEIGSRQRGRLGSATSSLSEFVVEVSVVLIVGAH